MKTIVYVDGFNLFYGLLKGTPNLWLDLELFARSLLTDKYEIAEIKYFTARVRGEPLDAISANDQYRYLCALANNPIVKIVEGYYKRYRAKMPFAKDPCKSCDKVAYATVWKVEEKKSDVNLAVEMTSDAYENKADAFVLISGDADHAAALSVATCLQSASFPKRLRLRTAAKSIVLRRGSEGLVSPCRILIASTQKARPLL